jgi:hypothetical protein
MADVDVIVQDPVTGLFGFRLELGRDRTGVRMQARRSGFVTQRAALAEYRRLSRLRDAQRPRQRLSDTVQTACQDWVNVRAQELQPNTVYNYGWLLWLVYPYVGRTRASRLSARMVEGAYRQLEAAGYSRTTLQTLDLVLAKAFLEQTGRTWGVHRPRDSDELRPVWTLAEARCFLEHVAGDRLYPLWRLLLMTGLRRGELCGLMWRDLEPDLATLAVRRQRVVEDPSEPGAGEAAQVAQRRPQSGPGPGDRGHPDRYPAADEGGAGLGVHVHRPLGSAATAGQRQQPIQPTRRRGRGPADRTASDPAPARLQPPRHRIRHHPKWRNGSGTTPRP